ncbi:copper resistance protein CopC [Corynebacterium macginleyi]|uniref:copper resistance CopC family protein n=1 Tax=Corynebacterium macginleyi TaxID=38290 RepID=UPI00190E0325|nr:copper resistance protein CopC [Corynebacterium macginleyi]MBK4167338.1 copper resistance protein CopC [Corynebacterium macginleyi]
MGQRVPWLRRATVAVGATALIAGGSAPLALAHDSVVGGTVKEGDQLEEFPKEITLEFSGIPKDQFNTFAVTNKDTGEQIFSQEPELDERYLTITTPDDVEPGPGSYQVGYNITSSDGHATRGGVSFTVTGEGGDDATSTDSADAESLNDMPTSVKIILGVGGALAIAAVLALLIAKIRRNNLKGQK